MRSRGQSTLEYVVLVAVVISALLAMRIYMKRGVQGKLRSSTDSIGAQYSPTDVSGTWTYHSEGKRNEVSSNNGETIANVTSNELQQKYGNETINLNANETKLF